MPPGGFLFYQPETDWKAPEWQSFAGLVSAIIDHRRANPRFNLPLDVPTVENEVDAYNTARLKAMPGGSDYLVGDEPVPSIVFPQPRRREGSAGAVAGSLKRSAAGIGTLVDWLGEGLEPVPRAQAEARAAVCVSCPLNQLGNFWQKLEAKAAQTLRDLVNAKNEMDLSTSVDSRLHSCMACDCWNPLKVHVPLPHIKKHLRPEQQQALWENCWVRKELSA